MWSYSEGSEVMSPPTASRPMEAVFSELVSDSERSASVRMPTSLYHAG